MSDQGIKVNVNLSAGFYDDVKQALNAYAENAPTPVEKMQRALFAAQILGGGFGGSK